MRRLALAALLLLALPAATAVGSAPLGHPWPGGRIAYYDAAPDQEWALQQAVAAWNASGANVHFVAVGRADAQVVVEHLAKSDCFVPGRSVGGEASLGAVPHGVVYVSQLDPTSEKCNRFATAQVLAHELGHVLGLGHEAKACAVMNAVGSIRGPALCPPVPVGTWNCGLLEPDDVAGAVALYGGSARRDPARSCPLYAGVAAPRSLRLAGSGVAGGVRATFVRPADPALPPFLHADAAQASFAAQLQRDRCPAATPTKARSAWQVGAGQTQEVEFGPLAAGRYCVAVRAFDAIGRPGPSATAWIRLV